jgi:hypothetical protein
VIHLVSKFVLVASNPSLISKLLNATCYMQCNKQKIETKNSYCTRLDQINSSTKIEGTIDKHIQEYTSLKEIGQVY